MGEVYGPYTHADWYTMRELRTDLRDMRKAPDKFAYAIQYTEKVLKEKFYQRVA